MPMEPARTPPTSLKMSPKVFSVRITSNWVGRRTICMAALSTNMCSSWTSGYWVASSVTTLRQSGGGF